MNDTYGRGNDRGAVIHPTDAYCHPEAVPDDSVLDWEIHPVDELEAAGIRPCEICFGEVSR